MRSVGDQRLAPARRRRGGDVALAADQRVERRQLHLGVTARREQPRRVAQRPVLALEGLLVEVVTDQPQCRARLLQVFAGAVDRLRLRVALVARLAEPLGGLVEAAEDHPPDSRRGVLVGEQAVGAARGRVRRVGRRRHPHILAPGGRFGQAAGRQRLVGVTLVPGQLRPEPGRRHEGIGLRARVELDLRGPQSVERAAVDVDLRPQALAERHVVAHLAHPPARGQRPERLEGPRLERHLDLLADLAVAGLRGQQQLAAEAPQPHLAACVERQIALLDRRRAARGPRHLLDQELPLDLAHAGIVGPESKPAPWIASPSSASATS